MEKEIEQNLWNSFREDDRIAFGRMFLKFNPILFSIGLKITNDRFLIEDCIHELFIDLWNKRSKLPSVDTVKYYVIVCFRRILLGYLKKNIRNVSICNVKKGISVNSAEYQLIEDQLNGEKLRNLQRAVENLPARQKEIIELRYMKSMSYDEINEIMAINYNSSRKLVYKAIINLKKQLKKNA